MNISAVKNIFRMRNQDLILYFITETARPGVPTDSSEGSKSPCEQLFGLKPVGCPSDPGVDIV